MQSMHYIEVIEIHIKVFLYFVISLLSLFIPSASETFWWMKQVFSFSSIRFYNSSCERGKENNKICFGTMTLGAIQNKL